MKRIKNKFLVLSVCAALTAGLVNVTAAPEDAVTETFDSLELNQRTSVFGYGDSNAKFETTDPTNEKLLNYAPRSGLFGKASTDKSLLYQTTEQKWKLADGTAFQPYNGMIYGLFNTAQNAAAGDTLLLSMNVAPLNFAAGDYIMARLAGDANYDMTLLSFQEETLKDGSGNPTERKRYISFGGDKVYLEPYYSGNRWIKLDIAIRLAAFSGENAPNTMTLYVDGRMVSAEKALSTPTQVKRMDLCRFYLKKAAAIYNEADRTVTNGFYLDDLTAAKFAQGESLPVMESQLTHDNSAIAAAIRGSYILPAEAWTVQEFLAGARDANASEIEVVDPSGNLAAEGPLRGNYVRITLNNGEERYIQALDRVVQTQEGFDYALGTKYEAPNNNSAFVRNGLNLDAAGYEGNAKGHSTVAGIGGKQAGDKALALVCNNLASNKNPALVFWTQQKFFPAQNAYLTENPNSCITVEWELYIKNLQFNTCNIYIDVTTDSGAYQATVAELTNWGKIYRGGGNIGTWQAGAWNKFAITMQKGSPVAELYLNGVKLGGDINLGGNAVQLQVLKLLPSNRTGDSNVIGFDNLTYYLGEYDPRDGLPADTAVAFQNMQVSGSDIFAPANLWADAYRKGMTTSADRVLLLDAETGLESGKSLVDQGDLLCLEKDGKRKYYTFAVKTGSAKLNAVSGVPLTIDQNQFIISGVPAGTTVDGLKAYLSEPVEIYAQDGTKPEGTAIVTNQMRVYLSVGDANNVYEIQ